MKNERLTLYELNSLVKEVIECEIPNEYWVEAELSECHESRGHCYMELIQKDEQTATPIAKAQARCWASKWMIVRPYFERTTGQRLHAGMKVLLKVKAQFHEAYGFSWIVSDIDPTYTLGDMARKRQEIIRQLKAEGVFDLQKELSLPLFCQRIAVISSETAAGYGDFCNQLTDNPYGFKFMTWLFPAIMQGDGVEQSVIQALNRINDVIDDFDCVVIIRGGHDRDESILDMVSHTRVKTPTAAASLLVDHLKKVFDALNDAQDTITHCAQQKLSTLNAQLSAISEAIPRLFSIVKTRQEARLDTCYQRIAHQMGLKLSTLNAQLSTIESRIPMVLERRLTSERHRLEILEEKVHSLDPALLLKRGYSITLFHGKAVRDPQDLKAGDEIETRLEKGTVVSKVLKY